MKLFLWSRLAKSYFINKQYQCL